MPGMAALKIALAEIVAVAQKHDVGLGITVSNEDSGRYLLRLPSYSIIKAAKDGSMAASIELKDGDAVVGTFDIDRNFSAPDAEARIQATVNALQSSADNMRRYADTVDGILAGLLRVLQEQGIEVCSVSDDDDDDIPRAFNTLPEAKGKPN